MLFAVMDGKMAGVRMVVMDGFEDSLPEAVMGDTGDCVCSKKVDEEVRLYGVWDIGLFADGKIAAVSMVVMESFEGNLREGVMRDTGDCVWGSSGDIGDVRQCHVWGVVVFAAVKGKIEHAAIEGWEGNMSEGVMEDRSRHKVVDMRVY